MAQIIQMKKFRKVMKTSILSTVGILNCDVCVRENNDCLCLDSIQSLRDSSEEILKVNLKEENDKDKVINLKGKRTLTFEIVKGYLKEQHYIINEDDLYLYVFLHRNYFVKYGDIRIQVFYSKDERTKMIGIKNLGFEHKMLNIELTNHKPEFFKNEIKNFEKLISSN